MAVTYFLAHLPQGWIPILNGGELAVLFCFAFLHLAARGGGTFGVDGLIAKRRAASARR
jgi:putative oxidoreductase